MMLKSTNVRGVLLGAPVSSGFLRSCRVRIKKLLPISSNSAAQANNPLANTTAINFQNYYVGEFTGLDENANQFILRAAQPFKIADTEWLARASLPVNTAPDNGGHTTGLGDFHLCGLSLRHRKSGAECRNRSAAHSADGHR